MRQIFKKLFGNNGETDISLVSDLVNAKVENAQLHTHNRCFDQALKSLEDALNLDPDNLRIQELRALVMMKGGFFDDALECCKNLLPRIPDSAPLHRAYAALLNKYGRYDEGRAVMRNFYKDHPIPTSALERQANCDIMIAHGFSNSDYILFHRNDKGYGPTHRGGHFTLQYLWTKRKQVAYPYYVAENNIIESPPAKTPKLVINTIADPDPENETLSTLAHYLSDNEDILVINDPENVRLTSRDKNYERLNTIPGIRFPKTMRFDHGDGDNTQLISAIHEKGFEFPFIIRIPGTQTARSTELVENKEELLAYLEDNTSDEVYIIEFVPNASDEGHYTKMRFFCIDGALYPVVRHVDQVWNVHGGNRKTFMADYDWMVEKEKQFLKDPASVIGEETYQAIQNLQSVIKLDFWGLDFTLLPDGDILIFELNPAMRHAFDHAKNFPYMHEHMQAITDAFGTMVHDRLNEVS